MSETNSHRDFNSKRSSSNNYKFILTIVIVSALTRRQASPQLEAVEWWLVHRCRNKNAAKERSLFPDKRTDNGQTDNSLEREFVCPGPRIVSCPVLSHTLSERNVGFEPFFTHFNQPFVRFCLAFVWIKFHLQTKPFCPVSTSQIGFSHQHRILPAIGCYMPA